MTVRNFTLCAALLLGMTGSALAQTAPAAAPAGPPRPPFLLSSPAFEMDGVLPNKFTQVSTTPVSPPLSWINTPANTQSFALVMHDLEPAPNRNSMDNTHWLLFNIPGTATSLPEGVAAVATLPDGTVQQNIRDQPGYRGPGAPPGIYHHYVLELFALDAKLALGAASTRQQVMDAMNGHVNGKAVLVAKFHR